VPTPRGDYGAGIEAARGLVLRLEARLGARATVGVGIPGAISPVTGLVKNANSTWLNGRPLQADLEAALGRPVRVENDANCLAVSEARDGAGAGVRVVFAVILGTGAGGGITVDGRPISGLQRIAGEWGHNTLPWMSEAEFPGPLCWCGKRGCLETFISGTGFERDFARETGEATAADEIVARMRGGDGAAAAAYVRYADRLARGLACVINILDPDVVVLGGGLSNVDELYADLPPLLPSHVFSDSCRTPIRKARHGDSSGVRGAAWLWPEDEA
jgi:fructokinase